MINGERVMRENKEQRYSISLAFKGLYLALMAPDNLRDAIIKGNVKLAQAHLEAATENLEDIPKCYSYAPIHLAVIYKQSGCLALLLEHKPNIDLLSRGDVQQTALHMAVYSAYFPAIKLLLLSGANYKTIKDDKNKTPLEAYKRLSNEKAGVIINELVSEIENIQELEQKAVTHLKVSQFVEAAKCYFAAGNIILDRFYSDETDGTTKEYIAKKALEQFKEIEFLSENRTSTVQMECRKLLLQVNCRFLELGYINLQINTKISKRNGFFGETSHKNISDDKSEEINEKTILRKKNA